MTTRPPVGDGERDEEYLIWSVEDFVKRMLENERRKAGSIRVWLDAVQTDFHGVIEVIKADLRNNRRLAQYDLDRPVQILGTEEEAAFVLWSVHGRLLQHVESRNVAAPAEVGALAELAGAVG